MREEYNLVNEEIKELEGYDFIEKKDDQDDQEDHKEHEDNEEHHEHEPIIYKEDENDNIPMNSQGNEANIIPDDNDNAKSVNDLIKISRKLLKMKQFRLINSIPKAMKLTT